MKELFTILTLTLCFTSFGQTKQGNTKFIDTSKIAVLAYDSTLTWIFKGGRQTNLSSTDFEIIDSLLTQSINTYNKEQEIKYRFNKPGKSYLVDLKKHKRQYIPIINDKGEKEVWVNCFCRTWDKNWKKEILRITDGGVCFFRLKINLTNKKHYDLYVNSTG